MSVESADDISIKSIDIYVNSMESISMSTSLWVCLKLGCPKIWRIIINVTLKQIGIWGVYPIVRHNKAQALDATETPVREINENRRGQRSNEQWSLLVGFTGSICGKPWFFQRTSRVFSRFSREPGNWDTIYQSYSLSVYLFVCPFVSSFSISPSISLYMLVCLSVCLSTPVDLSGCLFDGLSIKSSLANPIYLSISISLSIYLPVHPSICLSIFRPSIHSFCPSICLSSSIKSNQI